MMYKDWSNIEEVPFRFIVFFKSYDKFQGHTRKKNRRFWLELSVSGPSHKFELTDGFEMMHKA